MSSFIFNFETFSRYRRLPPRERLWHLAVAATMLATLVGVRLGLSRFAGRYKSNQIVAAREALSGRTEVVFLGDSHFYTGVRPDLFPFPTMTISGSGFNYQLLEAVLRKHLDRLSGLKLVVIAFDAHPLLHGRNLVGASNSAELADWGLSPDEVEYVPSSGRERTLERRLRDLDVGLRDLLVPPDRLSPTTLMNALGLRRDGVIAGHSPSNARFEPPPDGSGRVRRHMRIFKEEQFEPNCASLRDIIRLLDGRGVRVVLLRTPFHPSYAAARPPRWEALCDEALDRIRSDPELRRPVVVWDLMRSPDLPDAEFRDDDHLNSDGAVRLSNLLARRLGPLLSGSDAIDRQIAGPGPADPIARAADSRKGESPPTLNR